MHGKINTVSYSTKTFLFFCNRHGNFQNTLFFFRLLFSDFQQRNMVQKISYKLSMQCSLVVITGLLLYLLKMQITNIYALR